MIDMQSPIPELETFNVFSYYGVGAMQLQHHNQPLVVAHLHTMHGYLLVAPQKSEPCWLPVSYL